MTHDLLVRHAIAVSRRHETGAQTMRADGFGERSFQPGYEDFLTVMSDPDEPEHRDIKRWCGGHFDPEWFDLTTVAKDGRNALKPSVRRRLHQPKPKRAKQGA